MIELEKVRIAYGDQVIIPNFNLKVTSPGVTALVGPSGCGKSTLLKTIAGLQPYEGKINSSFPAKSVGLLFQDDELLPWENVVSNISLGLKFRKSPKDIIDKEVKHWLKRVRLSEFEKRYPESLSGGQRKRVAIAQCLILKPQLLLLDEPFSSLDAIVRRDIVDFIFTWIYKNNLSAVLVTHDLEEAISVANSVVILTQNGEISQKFEVNLPSEKPSVRKEDPEYGPFVNKLWKAMEKTFDEN